MVHLPGQPSSTHSNSTFSKSKGSRIVHGGLANLEDGVYEEAKREVEKKYAEEWKQAGPFRRWQLRKQMEQEIRTLAARKMPDVSPEAMF